VQIDQTQCPYHSQIFTQLTALDGLFDKGTTVRAHGGIFIETQRGKAATKKNGEYLAQSPQRAPSLKDQIDLGSGLRGLCGLDVLGASKSYVSDPCGGEHIEPHHAPVWFARLYRNEKCLFVTGQFSLQY
jgi:hypothetical protein